MGRVSAMLALAFLSCSSAWAETTPTDALREVFAQTDRILTDPDTEAGPLERLLAVRKLVNDAFDFRGAAELASGDHWRARTEAEQEEFTWLFGDLLERAFVSRMASKATLVGGTRIRYLGESIEEGTALVQTAMARRDGGELLLDYHLIEREGSWKIRDVAVDGISIMANYRAQLDRVLGTASFPELLTQMRAKVGAVDPPVRRVPIADVPRPEPELHLVVLAPVLPALNAEEPLIPVAIEERPAPRTLRTVAYWLQLMIAGTDGAPVDARVGPFQDAEEAVNRLLDLEAKGYDPFLVAERE